MGRDQVAAKDSVNAGEENTMTQNSDSPQTTDVNDSRSTHRSLAIQLKQAIRSLDAIAGVLDAYDLLGANGTHIDQTLWLDAVEELNRLRAIADEIVE